MIWLRRALTVPLILILIAILFIALLVTQVSNTAANAEFYNGLMREADVYDFVYDDVIPAALDEAETGDTLAIPVDISNIEDELVSIARTTFPPQWLQTQFESLTVTVIPYFVGGSDDFAYTLVLKDSVMSAGDAIKDEILHGDVFTYVYEDVIAYVAGELFDSLGELPPSVTITEQDIENALRITVTQEWLASQLEAAVDPILQYLSGDSDHFTISVPLQDVLTDEALLALLGEGNEDYLDEVRYWIDGQWSYTDSDLLNELDSNDEEMLQDVRNWINNGYTVTEADLRDALSDNQGALDDFDNIRSWIHTGRTWLWSLWLIPIIFVIAIGFLGGRRWKSRAAWALGSLLLASVIVFITIVLIYSNVGEPKISELKLNLDEYQGVEQVMAEKGNELIQRSADSFVSGLKANTIYAIIAPGVGLLGVIGWYIVDRRRKSAG